MRETADLARALGVRMHTHLAETREEDAYCRQALGRTPAEYAEDLGWLGPRLGAGIAPVRDLLQAGAAVGLGVDGAASSEGSSLAGELRQALLAARVRDGHGPSALTARQARWLGTRGGARCLGRDDETGALRPGLLADIAVAARRPRARRDRARPRRRPGRGPGARAAREVRAARLRLAGPELS
jgi:cytosine/adenosine deaminase-related metal-dependent hydrolase